MLRVYSIFDSIQGESAYQGFSTAFVRLAGCPLGCSYCDTEKARTADGIPMDIDEIVEKLCRSGMPYAEVTGGEPLVQDETPALLSLLVKKFKKVLLETSGAYSVEDVDSEVHVVMDIKCPGSGMADRFFSPNLSLLSKRDHELKFVITSRADFDWSVAFCESNLLFDRDIAFTPAERLLSPSDLARWILEKRLNARLRLQLHRTIWPDTEEER